MNEYTEAINHIDKALNILNNKLLVETDENLITIEDAIQELTLAKYRIEDDMEKSMRRLGMC